MEKRSGLYVGSLVAIVALGAVVWMFLDHSPPRPPAEEAGLAMLALSGPAAHQDAELSGLAWWNDTLLFLPQYPERFEHSLFALERAQIERAIDGDHTALEPRRVPFVSPVIDEAEHDGYEAIAIDGDEVFVTLEVSRDDPNAPVGRLFRGRVEGALERVVIDPSPHADLAPQNHISNIAYEALVLTPRSVLAIYETNGEVNPSPRALELDRATLAPRGALTMAPLEYRVTDATTMDPSGRFWVMNYHWPGAPWHTGACEITQRYGQGESHARCRTVERLVELERTRAGVALTDRPPIQLGAVDDDHPRNWEGVVRLGDRGFLVVTDEYPSTLFAFVPHR